MHPCKDPLFLSTIIFSISILLTILIAAICIIRVQWRSYKQKQDLYQNQYEVLQKERLRIASDVHDELGALLQLSLQQIDHYLEDPQQHAYMPLRVKNNLTRALIRMQHIIHGLYDQRVIQAGLKKSLTAIIRHYHQLYPVRFMIRYQVHSPLSKTQIYHLYHIIRELTHNTLKHSNAENVKIYFREQNRNIYIYYHDNGQGLPAGDAWKKSGNGFTNIELRIQLMKGFFTTGTHAGFYLYATIPISLKGNKTDHND